MTRRLGRTDIHIEPLVLGTNVVGWTADEATSFAIFDALLAEGFTAIDTADSYSRWVPGNDSESEKIIGRWLKARGNRDKVHVFTKVGSDMGQGHRDLSAKWIVEEVEASLKRLQTDYIDLYQSHWPDPNTPQEETLRAHDSLIKAGKVRWIGTSNYDEALLTEALDTSKREGLARYETIQNEFNLYARDRFEGAVQDICVAEEISGIHYWGLAAGFLTGKYRTAEDAKKSPRGGGVVGKYLNARGLKILAALDEVAARTGAAVSEIALSWIVAQPGVAAPIASATSVEQLQGLIRGARLTLSAEDLKLLTDSGK
ncbi:MAG: aldo/keto reductase [Hyphomicrobiales bacterium]|nr:MAG: aldo/keto reductase [Hyphomicrobiales bacterium]